MPLSTLFFISTHNTALCIKMASCPTNLLRKWFWEILYVIVSASTAFSWKAAILSICLYCRQNTAFEKNDVQQPSAFFVTHCLDDNVSSMGYTKGVVNMLFNKQCIHYLLLFTYLLMKLCLILTNPNVTNYVITW